MIKTYFTFGSASHFPYGTKDYVVIEALTQKHATDEFLKRFPGQDKDVLNCAFYYSEDEWKNGLEEKYYNGIEPAEYVTVSPTRDEIRNLVENFVYTSANAFILGNALCNAFPSQGYNLFDIVDQIQACELSDVDVIMNKLDEYGYLSMLDKENTRESNEEELEM